jgi:hypothetical protein
MYAEDGEQKVPKGTVHALKSFPGVECIFEERTESMVSGLSECMVFEDVSLIMLAGRRQGHIFP